MTSDEDIVELFSHEYTTALFTLGNGMGCPVWFAELLNRVLCCNYVYFDGVRYTRKESNVPELNQQIEGLKSFVFNQMLQKVRTMNPVLEWNNQLAMRCVQSGAYRIADDEGMRSIKYGSESGVAEVGAYINMTKAIPNTGVSINSDTMVTVNSIHHPGVDKNSYWDLIAIKTTDIDNKYIGRRGYGKLTVNGLDRLKNDLDNGSINLRAVLYKGDSYTNLIEGSVISRDGVCVLKGINGGDIGALKEFQLYLDNVYDCDIDNLGMTIELVWVYEMIKKRIMTETEKQQIISLVLQALKTNSLTIEQLTDTTELSKDMYVEVSGGRKISIDLLSSTIAKMVNGDFDALVENVNKIAKDLSDGDAELLKRITGVSDKSNPLTDPFKSIGSFTTIGSFKDKLKQCIPGILLLGIIGVFCLLIRLRFL